MLPSGDQSVYRRRTEVTEPADQYGLKRSVHQAMSAQLEVVRQAELNSMNRRVFPVGMT